MSSNKSNLSQPCRLGKIVRNPNLLGRQRSNRFKHPNLKLNNQFSAELQEQFHLLNKYSRPILASLKNEHQKIKNKLNRLKAKTLRNEALITEYTGKEKAAANKYHLFDMMILLCQTLILHPNSYKEGNVTLIEDGINNQAGKLKKYSWSEFFHNLFKRLKGDEPAPSAKWTFFDNLKTKAQTSEDELKLKKDNPKKRVR